MFETFAPIFLDQMQTEDNARRRYESKQKIAKAKGNNISYLLPPFDPESDHCDTYFLRG